MVTLTRLNVVFGGDASGLRDTINSVGRSVQQAGRQMQSAGRTLTRRVTAPLVAAGGAMLTSAADVERMAAEVRATAALTEDETERMVEGVENIAVVTGESMDGIFDAFQKGVSGSIDFREAMELTESATRATAAGFGETERLVDVATTGFDLFSDTAEGPVEILDQIVNAARNTQVDVDGVASAFSRAAPLVAEFGASQNDLLATLTVVSERMGDTQRGGRATAQMFQQLLKPTGDSADVIEELFGSVDNLQASLGEDLIGTMQTLQQELESSDRGLESVFTSSQSLNAAQLLLSDRGERAAEVLSQQDDAAGAVNEAFDASESFTRELSRTWQGLRQAIRPVGDVMIEMIVPVMQRFQGVLERVSDFVRELDDESITFALTLGAVAAAVGPLIFGIGTLMVVLGTLITPIGLVIGALVGAGGLVVALVGVEETIEFVEDTIQWFTDQLDRHADTIDTIVDVVVGIFSQLLDTVTTIFNGATDILTIFIQFLRGDFVGAHETVQNLMSDILSFLERSFERTFGEGGFLIGVIRGFGRLFSGIITGIIDGIRSSFRTGLNQIRERFSGWADSIRDTAEKLSFGLVGGSVFPDMVGGIIGEFSRLDLRTNEIMVETSERIQMQSKEMSGSIQDDFLDMTIASFDMMETMENRLEFGFREMMEGTKSFGEVLVDLWESIVSEILDMIAKLIARMVAVGIVSAALPGGGGFATGVLSVLDDLPGFQRGGTVPGRTGEPRLAVLHGGEQVTPASRTGGSETIEIELKGPRSTRALFEEMTKRIRRKTGRRK